MKTNNAIATVMVIALVLVFAVLAACMVSVGSQSAHRTQDGYTTVQAMQDEQDAIFAKGAR